MVANITYLVDIDLANAATIKNVPDPQNPGDVVPKSFVTSLVTGATIPTDLNCSSNPNYPASSAGARYIVTGNGLVGGASGIAVQIGDVIQARVDSLGGDQATAGADFFIVEGNRDAASTTVLGLVQLATQAEVNTGSNSTKAVVPSTLQTKLTNTLNAQTYSQAIGDGINTSFVVNHSLNSTSVVPILRNTSTGAIVMASLTVTDANNVTVAFNNPPTTNQYTLSVKK